MIGPQADYKGLVLRLYRGLALRSGHSIDIPESERSLYTALGSSKPLSINHIGYGSKRKPSGKTTGFGVFSSFYHGFFRYPAIFEPQPLAG